MSELANIVGELKIIHRSGDAWHGPALRDVLTGLTPDAAAWRLPNAHSIWEIVLHIAGWEEVFLRRLEGLLAASPEGGDFPHVAEVTDEAWEQALARLENAHERLLEVVSRFSDSDLKERVAGKDYTIGFMLHGLVRHHVYHAGQISLLRKIVAGS